MFMAGKGIVQTGLTCSRPVSGDTGFRVVTDTEDAIPCTGVRRRSRQFYHVRNKEDVRGG